MTWMRKWKKRSLKNTGGTELDGMANMLDWKGNLTETHIKRIEKCKHRMGERQLRSNTCEKDT